MRIALLCFVAACGGMVETAEVERATDGGGPNVAELCPGGRLGPVSSRGLFCDEPKPYQRTCLPGCVAGCSDDAIIGGTTLRADVGCVERRNGNARWFCCGAE
jgi:hypothetical protein